MTRGIASNGKSCSLKVLFLYIHPSCVYKELRVTQQKTLRDIRNVSVHIIAVSLYTIIQFNVVICQSLEMNIYCVSNKVHRHQYFPTMFLSSAV